MDLPNSFADTHGWTASWLLPIFAVVLVVVRALALRRFRAGRLTEVSRARADRAVTIALAIGAVVAVMNYVDYGRFRYGTYLNEWDCYHQYIGTKYVRELGCTHIYEATVVADHEAGPRNRNHGGTVRDLASYDSVPVERVLADAARVRARFSPGRWREFVADIGWFKRQLPAHRWSIIVDDHGYNGTPPWTAVVGLITNALSVRDAPSRWAMILLDPALLAGMVACIAWAYGLDAALLVVIFLGTHYLLSWGHLKGCILRTDFVVCAVGAACSLKRERYRTAGALAAWAVIAKGFPVIFLAGPGVLFASRLAVERRIDRDLLRFFGAFALTLGAFGLFAAYRFDGLSLFREWWQKIVLHAVEGSDWNIGFTSLIDVDFSDGTPQRFSVVRMLVEEPELARIRALMLWVVRLGVLAPTLYLVRWLRAHEAYAVGFVGVFFLVSPDSYYFIVLCLPLLFFSEGPATMERAVGISWMFLTGAGGYLLFSGWRRMRDVSMVFHGYHQSFGTTFFISWGIAITALHMVAMVALRVRRLQTPAGALGGS